jgi:hypothetical protein
MLAPPPKQACLFAFNLLVSGCVARTAVDTFGEVDAVDEILVDGDVTGARAAPGNRILVGKDDGLLLLEAGQLPVTLSEEAANPLGAAVHDGGLLALLDAGLFVVSRGELAATPLADALDGPPLEISAAGETLWFRTEGGVRVLRGGSLAALAVEETPLTGPLAAGIAADGTPLAWIGAGERLVAISSIGALRVDRALAVESLATDGAGQVWVVSDGELVRGALEGPWHHYVLPDPVTSVTADPGAPGAWIRAGSAIYRVSSTEEATTEEAHFDLLGGDLSPTGFATDPLGRLLAWNGVDLHRVTAGRVIEVLGLEEGAVVDNRATVTLLPTSPTDVATMSVTVDGTPIAAEPGTDGSWVATVDAVSFAGEGSRSLVATATYTGGQEATSEPVHFTVGSIGEVTWSLHVLPLYQAHCALCHGGDSATVLEGPDVWQSRIDDILLQVEAGSMPLGRDPLTDGDIAVLTTWRDGGFLP